VVSPQEVVQSTSRNQNAPAETPYRELFQGDQTVDRSEADAQELCRFFLAQYDGFAYLFENC